eukprot:scaffold62017_cov51-Attheya_sp.AAC.3
MPIQQNYNYLAISPNVLATIPVAQTPPTYDTSNMSLPEKVYDILSDLRRAVRHSSTTPNWTKIPMDTAR